MSRRLLVFHVHSPIRQQSGVLHEIPSTNSMITLRASVQTCHTLDKDTTWLECLHHASTIRWSPLVGLKDCFEVHKPATQQQNHCKTHSKSADYRANVRKMFWAKFYDKANARRKQLRYFIITCNLIGVKPVFHDKRLYLLPIMPQIKKLI